MSRARKPAPVVLAFDTEDDSNGHVRIINFYDGRDHATFTGTDSREKAWSWLAARAPAILWACNLEYDLLNLCGPWTGKLWTLQYVGSGLMRASLREAAVTAYDTLRHWSLSVAAMGEYLGLPKLPANFTSRTYCRRDTEIVWRFVQAMVGRYTAEGLRLRPTLPGMALQLFRRSYGKPLPELPATIVERFREGYYGGRTEVFRYGEVRSRMYLYDVNSLFPAMMNDREFPDLRTWRWTESPDFSREGMASVELTLPACAIPGLPLRTGTELLYAYGRLAGTWCYPEIRQALTDGAVLHRVEWAIEFPETERPFPAFVQRCYRERQAAPAQGLDNIFWKLIMNSLYGKFGQRTDGMDMIFDDEHRLLPTRSRFANVIWSAYITSYARLCLLGLLRGCREVYYTDTDSLFTPDVLPHGPGLGQLKLERSPAGMLFAGNKLYVEMDAEGHDIAAKAKGVPRGQARDFIRTGRAVFRRPARYRESRRSFARANVWYLVEKSLEADYSKRVVRADGTTEPWDYQDYLRVQGEG